GIVLRQEIKKVRRNRECEFVARERSAAALFVTQIQVFFQLSQRSDPVLELPFPIVPESLSCLWPIPWRVRDELFSVPFFLGNHFQLWTKKLRALNIVSTEALVCALRTR